VVITAAVTAAFAAFMLPVRSGQKEAPEPLTCASAAARETIASSLPPVQAETVERASLTADSVEKAAASLAGVAIAASASILLRAPLVAAVAAEALRQAAVEDAAPLEKPATKTFKISLPAIPEQLGRSRWVERAEAPAATIWLGVRAVAVAEGIMAAVAAAAEPTVAVKTVSERVSDRVAAVAVVRRSLCLAQKVSTSKQVTAATKTG
jgi:hypothetical protein